MFCLQMSILYLEAGVLCAQEEKAVGGGQKQLYLELMEDLESGFRYHQESRGNKIVLLLCLVGTRMDKRWMHFSTWTFTPDYKVG